ncbi:MAG: hypothetical protein PHI18_10510 [bacterium]|nr:hypothetical protein [bacterium]
MASKGSSFSGGVTTVFSADTSDIKKAVKEVKQAKQEVEGKPANFKIKSESTTEIRRAARLSAEESVKAFDDNVQAEFNRRAKRLADREGRGRTLTAIRNRLGPEQALRLFGEDREQRQFKAFLAGEKGGGWIQQIASAGSMSGAAKAAFGGMGGFGAVAAGAAIAAPFVWGASKWNSGQIAGLEAQRAATGEFLTPGGSLGTIQHNAQRMGELASMREGLWGSIASKIPIYGANREYQIRYEEQTIRDVTKAGAQARSNRIGLGAQLASLQSNPMEAAKISATAQREELSLAWTQANMSYQAAVEANNPIARIQAHFARKSAKDSLSVFDTTVGPAVRVNAARELAGNTIAARAGRMASSYEGKALQARRAFDSKGEFLATQAAGYAEAFAGFEQERADIARLAANDPRRGPRTEALRIKQENYESQMALAARDYSMSIPYAAVTSGREGFGGFMLPSSETWMKTAQGDFINEIRKGVGMLADTLKSLFNMP